MSGAADCTIDVAEDRLRSRLRDAGLSHADPPIWVFKAAFGAAGPCAPACALCALLPHVRAALNEAANAKVAEAARLLRAAAGRWAGHGPRVAEALEALALAVEDMRAGRDA